VLQNAKLPVRDMKVNTDLASVSLVAREITAKHEVNAIETMKVNDVPSIAIAWYRQRLTLLVPHSLVGAAANALHLQFAAVELVA
jgi:aspartokinase